MMQSVYSTVQCIIVLLLFSILLYTHFYQGALKKKTIQLYYFCFFKFFLKKTKQKFNNNPQVQKCFSYTQF